MEAPLHDITTNMRVFRKIIKTIGLIFAALVVLAGAGIIVKLLTSHPATPHPWFAAQPGQNKPLVFAHQGGEGLWPSNTMLGFDNSAKLGADVLDTDMHMTKDGALVLMHDETVNRTTNGTGAIRDLTLAEIKKLDAAYSFSTDGGKTFPYRGQGVTVPTLEELFRAYPDKRIGIEIKQTEPEATAKAFCQAIRKANMQNKVLVSSFRQQNMLAFRRECPEIATSATEIEARDFFVAQMIGLQGIITPEYQSLQIPERNSGFTLLTAQFIAAAHSRGLPVQPWTINTEDDLRRIIALGVDAINTDYPDRMLKILSK